MDNNNNEYFNLDHYLKRINFTKIKEQIEKCDVKLLKEIQRSHILSVPFENLEIHRGKKIELDLKKIYHKVVRKLILINL